MWGSDRLYPYSMRARGSYPISLKPKTPARRLALVIPYFEPVLDSVKHEVIICTVKARSFIPSFDTWFCSFVYGRITESGESCSNTDVDHYHNAFSDCLISICGGMNEWMV